MAKKKKKKMPLACYKQPERLKVVCVGQSTSDLLSCIYSKIKDSCQQARVKQKGRHPAVNVCLPGGW